MGTKKECRTTKAQCLKQIKEINGVCSGCGGKITPIETVDNAGNPTFWGHCRKCSKFCWGIDKTTWKIARRMVEEFRLVPYSHLQEGEYQKTKLDRDYWLNSQTAGAISIVAEILLINKEIKNKLK